MDLNKYIGLDYETCDCWELIRMIYKDELDIELPDYRKQYKNSGDMAQTGPVVASGRSDGNWEKVDEPEVNDVIIFNILGIPSHCGMYIGDGDFIHAFNGSNSVIENMSDLSWSRRIDGVYKWKSNA